MPEEKPAQTSKVMPKLVPESDLLAFKKGSLERERRLKEELTRVKEALSGAEAEVEIGKTNVEDDEEVSKVRTYLLGEEKKLRQERAKLEKDLTSFKEREREAGVKALVSKYGVDEESISAEEDPEKKALELYAERLTREKEEAKVTSPSPESIYETQTPGVVKTQPRDMSAADFDRYWAKEKSAALSKK